MGGNLLHLDKLHGLASSQKKKSPVTINVGGTGGNGCRGPDVKGRERMGKACHVLSGSM